MTFYAPEGGGSAEAGAGDAEGGGEAKRPRRRGSRGGRGRGKKVVGKAPAAGGETIAKTPAKPRSRSTAGTRRKAPAAPKPAAAASIAEPPVEDVPVASPGEVLEEQTHETASGQAGVVQTAEEGRENAGNAVEAPRGGDNAPPVGGAAPGGTAAGVGGFVPGPPRVGMRPAVIRPAPTSRMSFSKGTVRHQFRPSGFRPPRPFVPPATGVAPAAGMEEAVQDDVRAGEGSAPAPQGVPHPVPQPRHSQQGGQGHGGGGGGGRGQQQGRQHPQGRQGGGGGGGGQGRQGQQQRQGQPGRQGQGPMRQDQRGAQGVQGHRQAAPTGRGAPGFRAPAPSAMPLGGGESGPDFGAVAGHLNVGAGERAAGAGGVGGTGSDLTPLPPQPQAAGGETFVPGSTALHTPSPTDSAALAPFAEDIEIEEDLSQLPARRRELTGRDMLINVVEGEEIRIAVVKRGSLEELYMERSSTESHIGNIYKGRVTNVEPSIQAAFIDFGIGKNGFLHISDVHPQYFPKKMQPRMQVQQRRGGGGGQHPRGGAVAPAAGAMGSAAGVAPAAAATGTEASQMAAAEGTEQRQEQPLQQAVSAEMPAVSFDNQATPEANHNGGAVDERAAEQVSEAAPNGAAEASGSAEGNGAREANSGAEGQTTGNGEEHAAESGGEEEAPADEQADFGSAYSAEFADDEFEDDYSSEASDDELDDGHMKPMEKVGRKTPRHERPQIQQCLRRGQEVIVQVTKEGIGTKGPTLTSYISCPGRYLVMMPGMAQLGVSRKIEDLDQRRALKRTLQELNPPKNLGFIIRTAGTEVSKKELQGDLNYLVRMWKVIANRIRTHKAPVELYQESDLVIRTIRDVFTDEIDRIIVDNEQVASRIRDFLSIVDPRSSGIVELYTGTMPLYQKFGVEREIEKINSRRVELPNGGSLVIDSTEALVAIDVNSGRYREMRDAELTAFNMNKEALKEVVRQLRLRDLGGVIVIDFIDMREQRHKREIERLLADEMSRDRARTKVLPMSQFCMIELTRQRVRPSLKRSIYMDCPHCHGSALIKTPESVSLDVMRRLAAGATRIDVARLEVKAYPTVATFLLNRKRKALVELEEKTGKRINVSPDEGLAGDQIVISPYTAGSVLLNLVL